MSDHVRDKSYMYMRHSHVRDETSRTCLVHAHVHAPYPDMSHAPSARTPASVHPCTSAPVHLCSPRVRSAPCLPVDAHVHAHIVESRTCPCTCSKACTCSDCRPPAHPHEMHTLHPCVFPHRLFHVIHKGSALPSQKVGDGAPSSVASASSDSAAFGSTKYQYLS